MLSNIDDLLEDGEEIEETVYPSRLDSRYILGAGSFFFFLAVSMAYIYMFSSFDVISIGLIAVGLIVFMFFEIKRRFVMYHFTSMKIVKETGIFNKDVSSIPYSRIIEVSIDKDIEERIFGLGDVHIKTAGTDSTEMVLGGLKDPIAYKRRIGEWISMDYGETMGEKPVERPQSSQNPQQQSLEAELGKITVQKKELQEKYEAGEMSEQQYRREWYRLEGAKEQILSQMEQRENG